MIRKYFFGIINLIKLPFHMILNQIVRLYDQVLVFHFHCLIWLVNLPLNLCQVFQSYPQQIVQTLRMKIVSIDLTNRHSI